MMSYWGEKYRNVGLSGDYDGWLDGVALESGIKVLDLGCGAGTNLPVLLARGTRVTAADLSPEAVQLVVEGFTGRLEGADCFDMRAGFPYGDGAFDAVIADLSLHYFSWEDTRRIIAGLARILRKGGRLIARVHSMKNLPADAEKIGDGYYLAYGYPRRYFTAENVRELLQTGIWRRLRKPRPRATAA